MKRLLLLLPLVALAACSGNLPESDCLALEDTKARLLAKSIEAAEKATDVEMGPRYTRNQACDGKPHTVREEGGSTQELWRDCSFRLAKEAGIKTTNAEVNLLTGKDYVFDLVITTNAGQKLIDESRKWRAKAQATAEKTKNGNCVLSQ